MECQTRETMQMPPSSSHVPVRFFVVQPAPKSASKARLARVPIASMLRDEEQVQRVPHHPRPLSLTHVLRVINPLAITAMPSHPDARACSVTRALTERRSLVDLSHIAPRRLFSMHTHGTI